MKPFEALAALAVGLTIYAALIVGFHVTSGLPARWDLELFGLVAFLVGALAARELWK